MFKTPIGTHDVLPEASARRAALVAAFAELGATYGFGELATPIFESAEVFGALGEQTDVVGKEMYVFADRSDRQMALRPEGTAAICRAFTQHRPTLPWKVTYGGPYFRYEAPQAGRFRQFHQLGAETLGTDDPDSDVEIIALANDVLRAAGLSQVELLVNSMGDHETRAAHHEALSQFLMAVTQQLDVDDRPKVETLPLRVLDSKRPATIAATADAPKITDYLDEAGEARFGRVLAGLDALGITYTVEPRLVRGLDYYTHTTFEFKSTALDAAQDTVCGGGRYNGLVESLGGPPTPGIGFALGVERLLLACDAESTFAVEPPTPQVWVVDVTDGSSARDLCALLRSAGIRADRAFDGRSMRAQLKLADRSRAELAAIVGSDELEAGTVTLRELRRAAAGDGYEQRSVARAELVSEVRKLLTASQVS